jgi:hypothetical protein
MKITINNTYDLDLDDLLSGRSDRVGLARDGVDVGPCTWDGTYLECRVDLGDTVYDHLNRVVARVITSSVRTAGSLDQLLTTLRLLDGGEGVDMSALPTFGPAPSDTQGVWSWDASRLLVGDGWSDLEIVAR